MVAHIGEAEAGRSPKVWTTQQVQGQPELHTETLSQKKKKFFLNLLGIQWLKLLVTHQNPLPLPALELRKPPLAKSALA